MRIQAHDIDWGVKELTILHFRERETVLYQGEPATFFGVVLKGALVPVVGGERTSGKDASPCSHLESMTMLKLTLATLVPLR